MMLVTVGLERFPFDRLLRLVDRLVESGTVRGPVFGQIGHSRYEPRQFEFCRFLPFDQMRQRLQEADAVLCHGGVGTIMLAVSLGKVPLVFPRRAEFGEQLDDHQLDLASRLAAGGRVLVADTEESLADQISRYDELKNALPARSAPAEMDALVNFLHSALKARHVR